MEKNFFWGLSLVLMMLLGSSCKKYEEMPPLPENNQANRLYKIKDPRPMTPDEIDIDKQTKDEYNKNSQ